MSGPGLSTSRQIWAIALPAMLTSVATAAFGLADIWIIGRLGDAAAQGAVEIGAKLLMSLLIVFNFLRTGTIALTAQAAGRGDADAQAAALARAIAVALLIGALLLIARPLLVPLGLDMLGAKARVADQAIAYVHIRYWGALPWLVNAALTGWLIGRRQVRAVLAVEVAANLIHIALDAALVLEFGLGVEGVAVATLASETVKLFALGAIVFGSETARHALALARARSTWAAAELGLLFRLNRDLFGRTVLLMASTVIVTRAGADQGPVILAANAILYQLFILAALILDGFESAAQVLCGEAAGARDRERFERFVRGNLGWGLATGAVVTLIYAAIGAPVAASFSTDAAVAETARLYLPWAAALPILGVTSFVLDGVFIGATWTRAMLLTMAGALAAFVLLLLALGGFGNHGLWLAWCAFFVARAAGQAALLPRLMRRSFGG